MNQEINQLAGAGHFQDRFGLLGKVDFFQPNFDDAGPRQVDTLQIDSVLLPILLRRNLVILGGKQRGEKLLFAKHLISRLMQRPGGGCKCWQWYQQASPFHLGEVQGDDKYKAAGTIFFFPEIKPYHLGGYDLIRIREDLSRCGHYAVFTTDSEPQQWGITNGAVVQDSWCDAAAIEFAPNFLVSQLRIRLNEKAAVLAVRHPRLPSSFQAMTPLAGNLTVQDLALRLRTPSRIRIFVEELCSVTEMTEARLKELLQGHAAEEHSINLWFRKLSPREQLFALALSFFDGLLEDQVFAGLEFLVQDGWRDWDPNLAQFDYHELENLATCFSHQGAGGASRISSHSAICREVIFGAGWSLHRRRLLATLPILADLVRESPGGAGILAIQKEARTAPQEDEESPETTEATENLSEREAQASRWFRHSRWRDLFGNRLRTSLFENCIASVLSQLGRLSPAAVEPVLLDMAGDPSFNVQAVAALALARWRELDPGKVGDDRLFAMLKEWQKESFEKEWAERRRRGRRNQVNRLAQIRATIALLVGRAALYDPPNRLHSELKGLFERFLGDPNPIVRRSFGVGTLPWLATGHLAQLNELLWDRALLEEDLLVGLAVGISGACLFRPAEAQPILDRWYRRAAAISAQSADEKERIRRVHGLTVVALAYGLFDSRNRPGLLSVDEIFDLLLRLLDTEDHPRIRSAALTAMMRQARNDLRQVAPSIQRLIDKLSLEEREIVAVLFTDLYLDQRRRLSGGKNGASPPDDYEEVKGFSYPLWILVQRPLTEVEEVLAGWRGDPGQKAALQLAFECLENFASTPLEEMERQRQEAAKSQAAEIAEDPPEPSSKRIPVRALSWSGQLIALAVSPFSWRRRRVLAGAMPEVLRRIPAIFERRRKTVGQIWNRGQPKWAMLRQKETLQALLAYPGAEDVVLLRRLALTGTSADSRLAARLALACSFYAWRWPLTLTGALLLLVGALQLWRWLLPT